MDHQYVDALCHSFIIIYGIVNLVMAYYCLIHIKSYYIIFDISKKTHYIIIYREMPMIYHIGHPGDKGTKLSHGKTHP